MLGVPMPQGGGGALTSNAPALEATARQVAVADMILAGANYNTMAQKLGVSIGSIHFDVMRCIEIWQAYQLDKMEQWMTLELAKLGQIEAESWSAWHRSQVPTFEGRPLKSKIRRAGDWHFLDMALKAHQRRCEMLGLDAPKREVLEYNHNYDLSLDERALRVVEILEAARARRSASIDGSFTEAGSGPGDGSGDVDRAELSDPGDDGQPAEVGAISEEVAA
jgi:DNA-binding CsgD family transcriptional regulator